MKCFMKLKFRPYAWITFIFSWLKYDEILKTLESQVGWALQKICGTTAGVISVGQTWICDNPDQILYSYFSRSTDFYSALN